MNRALLASAILFFSSEARAFELTRTATGAEVHWDPPSLAYGVELTIGDPDGERFAAAVRAAADAWVIGSGLGIRAEWQGPHAQIAPDDGLNTIALAAEWNTDFGETARTVAHTELRYQVDSGRMLEADVFLNGETFSFDSEEGAFDAESVVLHELGHVLGVDHSCGLAGRTYPSCFSVPEPERLRVLEAVMAPTLAPGVLRRALTADDLDAVSVHYPATSTGAVPRALSLSLRCPEEILAFDAEGSAPLLATLRYGNGEITGLEAGYHDDRGGADLIVRDPDTGLYGALYLVAPAPASCEAPAPREGGCGCRTHRQAGGNGVMLWIVFVLAMTSVWRRWSILSTVLLTSVLFAADALAYKCSRVGASYGPSLIWQTRTIPWYADEGLFDVFGDRVRAEEDMKASFAAWEDVACSDLTFPLAAIIPGLRAGYDQTGDNKNVVIALAADWPYDQGAIAVTTSAYDTRTGVVVDADIEINAEHFSFTRVDSSCVANEGTMDLRNTVTHEVGHVIGLDHPPSTPRYQETTMFASAPPCEEKKRTLADDDVEGICSIYPIGNPTRQCYPPDGPSFTQVDQDDGFGGCTTSPGTSDWLAILIGALVIGARRRFGRSAVSSPDPSS